MPTMKLRFPGGRYHATPWGHHVNEGLIEWPPSPWRLIRALIACGFATQQWREVPTLARSLIEKLADDLPSYQLPAVTTAHTRHFMPYIEGKNQKTTLVWDAFANIGDGEMFVQWPCELESEETALLAQLAQNLNYLGRSESWVEAELMEDLQNVSCNAVPYRKGDQKDRNWEQISLMAPIPADSYRTWQQEKEKGAVAHLDQPSEKRRPTAKQNAEREKLIAPYPPDLVACVTKDTSWWKSHGWSQPPGSQRVLYWRPSQPMQVTATRHASHREWPRVEMMLLALTTPSGNKSALPSITRTLPQAELFHRAIVGRAGKGHQIDCPELTGREGGKPRRDHLHSHILPLDLDRDGRLDHVLIYAKMGLGQIAQQAIRGLRRTWTKSGHDLQVALVGHGDLNSLRDLPEPYEKCFRELLGPAEGACIWESATPFVPPRFLKRGGRNTLLGQINAELASRQLPAVETFELLPRETVIHHLQRHSVRRRAHGGVAPPNDLGFALRLVFAKPFRGPLALGYASHFGLGLFRAISD